MNLVQSLARDAERPGPFTRTKNYEECRARVREATSTHCLSVGDRSHFLGFAHYGYPVGKLSLDVVQVVTTCGFEVVKEKPNDMYYFQFLLQGSCRIEGLRGVGAAEAYPGDILVIEPNQITHEFWPGKCLQLMVRVQREVLEHAMAAELGKKLTGHLDFQPVARDCGIASWLRYMIGVQLRGKDQHSILKDARVLRSIERTVLTMVITGVPHSKIDELTEPRSRIAPYYVKRAEEYIRSTATSEIIMEDIVAAASVSERTLFYGFKRWRNTTPMAYVWDVRLSHAHQELKNTRHTGGTVSQAAIDAGFTSFSHFAKMYKARYGETPSATLRGLGSSFVYPD